MRPSKYIADFDSASAILRAVARYLEGKDFPQLGQVNPLLRPLGLVNKLPDALRKRVYITGGKVEASNPEEIERIRAEDIAGWMTDHFPARRYPGVMIGSTNGAAAHLCAALGMPYLPQTFLVPVRHNGGVHPDEPRYAMEAFRKPAEAVLKNNPDLQLHHMHDANQDELMIRTMGYFRFKRRRLGANWETFLRERVTPGGTIFLVECGLKWPVHQVSSRYFFQHGAVGGLTPKECYEGSPRVTERLKERGSHRVDVDPPPPTADKPEAEWGFEPALRDDVERLAREMGYRVRRVSFREPADLSPFVADFHRWWYRQRGIETSRLVAESFICMEPWLMLQTGSIPFWMIFNTESSAKELAKYVEEAGPFDEIYTTLFSHGVNSVGLAPIDLWKSILQRARKKWGMVGVDEKAFPRDFATFIRYHTDFKKKIVDRYPMPEPLAVDQLDRFIAENGKKYPVSWSDSVQANLRQAS